VKGVRKENLPTKICATCGRPFAWRKKWERDWESVRYCSDRCRSTRKVTDPLHTTDPLSAPGSSQRR